MSKFALTCMSRKYVALFLAIAMWSAFTGTSSADTLPIQPVQQQTYVWCWVAVGEMVFKFYGVPGVNPAGNYQCGIIGLLAVGTWAEACAYRCEFCIVPAGSGQALSNMFEEYPRRVAQVTGRSVAKLAVEYKGMALAPNDLISAIDLDHPVVAGISPSGSPPGFSASQHVALIVGYRMESGRLKLRVNDPFPFVGWQQNPYILAGGSPSNGLSYWIDYANFSARLSWRESFVISRVGAHSPPARGAHCCFISATGPGNCPLNLTGPLPLGSTCSCNFGYMETYVGTVCQ